jgi:hypothetical protein
MTVENADLSPNAPDPNGIMKQAIEAFQAKYSPEEWDGIKVFRMPNYPNFKLHMTAPDGRDSGPNLIQCSPDCGIVVNRILENFREQWQRRNSPAPGTQI